MPCPHLGIALSRVWERRGGEGPAMSKGTVCHYRIPGHAHLRAILSLRHVSCPSPAICTRAPLSSQQPTLCWAHTLPPAPAPSRLPGTQRIGPKHPTGRKAEDQECKAHCNQKLFPCLLTPQQEHSTQEGVLVGGQSALYPVPLHTAPGSVRPDAA